MENFIHNIVKCNHCEVLFDEEDIITIDDIETCPNCKKDDALMDYSKEYSHKDINISNINCLEYMDKLLQDGIKVDMVLTDPPYGIDYQNNYTLNKHKKIENDDVIDYSTFGKKCYDLLKDGSHAYFFTRFDVYPEHYRQLTEIGFKVKNVLIVEKGHIGGVGDLKGSYANNSEWIIFCQKGRREFEKTELMENSKEKVGKKSAREGNIVPKYKTRFNSCWFGDNYPKSTYNSSWQKKNDVYHPTVKNVEFLKWVIQISSKEGEVILDPFNGSGSTSLACLETERKFYGCEIDKEYFEMSIKRLSK